MDGRTFEDFVELLARAYTDDEIIPPRLGAQCKACEFRIPEEQKATGLKSGFDQCWTSTLNFKKSDLKRPLVFDVWNFRKAEKLIAAGTYFVDQIHEEDVGPKAGEEGRGLSSSGRQWLQISKVADGDGRPFIDVDGLRSEISRWTFPLNFIDFETTNLGELWFAMRFLKAVQNTELEFPLHPPVGKNQPADTDIAIVDPGGEADLVIRRCLFKCRRFARCSAQWLVLYGPVRSAGLVRDRDREEVQY